MSEAFSWVRRASQAGTRLMTALCGELVGEDDYGNRYYETRQGRFCGKPRRWVLYAGAPEATKVPPEGFAWLHGQCDQPLPKQGASRYGWLKPHHPNLTGTEAADYPLGHTLCRLSQKGRVSGHRGTQPWQPPE